MASRENILNRIKTARENRPATVSAEPDFGSPIYLEPAGNLADWFQENLELLSGQVFRAKNISEAAELLAKLQAEHGWERIFCADPVLQAALAPKVVYQSESADFIDLQVGVTPCEFLVAHLGSVMISAGGASGRRLHVFPETHVVIAHSRQLVKFLDDGLEALQTKYNGTLPSSITTITGPSRTADIEKTLVMGMHGPKRLVVLLCDEPF